MGESGHSSGSRNRPGSARECDVKCPAYSRLVAFSAPGPIGKDRGGRIHEEFGGYGTAPDARDAFSLDLLWSILFVYSRRSMESIRLSFGFRLLSYMPN